MNKTFYKKGFTLIELMVVIAIIALMSSIILSSLRLTKIKGRDGLRKSDLIQVRNALELYYADHGAYPTTLSSGRLYWHDSNNNPTDWVPSLAPQYIKVLPREPDGVAAVCEGVSDSYGISYRYKSDGTTYKITDHCQPITADVLNTNDPMYDCGEDHHPSWSIWSGTTTQPWCDGSDVGGANDDNLYQF